MNIRLSERGILPHPETVQTAAIQAAIDECAESGGGTVYFDAGIYRTGRVCTVTFSGFKRAICSRL